MKRFKNVLYISAICVLLVSAYLLDKSVPKEVNWQYDFTSLSKSAHGCKILRENLGYVFPGKEIKNLYDTPYMVLDTADVRKRAYVVINDEFNPDNSEIEVIYRFLEEGGTVFISSVALGEEFVNKFGVILTEADYSQREDTVRLGDADGNNPIYKTTIPYEPLVYLDSVKENYLIHGTNISGKVNFFSVQSGAGRLYIHLLPWTFGNYYLTERDNHLYPYRALSVIPVKDILWDEYYKSGKILISSPLRYVLNNNYLVWTYYILLASALLFIFFHGRREQRIIPVIKPFENSTLHFLRRIALLQKYNATPYEKMDDIFDRFKSHSSLVFKQDEDIFSESAIQNINRSFPGAGDDLREIKSFYHVHRKTREGSLKFLELYKLIHKFYNKYGLYGKF